MILVFILAAFCFAHARKAKAKGLNSLMWVLYTILACFVTLIIGAAIASVIILNKFPGLKPDQIPEIVAKGGLFWNMMFVFVSSIGGCLFVKYMLDKVPDNNNESKDTHWMDRLGKPDQ